MTRTPPLLAALALASCGSATTTTPPPPPPTETPLHAFVVELCSLTSRVVQDTNRPLEARMEELGDWVRRADHAAMGRELEARSEALTGLTELERARRVLGEVAPDVDCSSLFTLLGMMEEAGGGPTGGDRNH